MVFFRPNQAGRRQCHGPGSALLQPLSQATCSEISPWHSQAAPALPRAAGWINTGFGLHKEQAFLHQLQSRTRSTRRALPLSAGLEQDGHGWGRSSSRVRPWPGTDSAGCLLLTPRTQRGLQMTATNSSHTTQLGPPQPAPHSHSAALRETKSLPEVENKPHPTKSVGKKSPVPPGEARGAPGNAAGPEQGAGVWENPPWSPAAGPPAASGSCCGHRNISS